MKIFGREDIKTTVAAEPVNAGRKNAEAVKVKAPASLQNQVLTMMLMYAVVGGAVGFALRALLYMAGFKQWMFLHFTSFVDWGNVLTSVNGEWGSFLLMMLAFFGAIWGIFQAMNKIWEV